MSCNRENVTWQSQDGKWNIGFWEFYDVGSDDEDWDYEWDVEYSFDRFWFASTGHATEEAAYQAYTAQNANPGGTTIYAFDRAEHGPYDQTENARFDKKAAALKKANKDAEAAYQKKYGTKLAAWR